MRSDMFSVLTNIRSIYQSNLEGLQIKKYILFNYYFLILKGINNLALFPKLNLPMNYVCKVANIAPLLSRKNIN